jgi:hypothetical protein
MNRPGKPMPQQRNGKTALRVRDRMEMALKLRRGGATFHVIAQTMGICTAAAHGLVSKALVRTLQEPADEVRALEVHRLDALWEKWFPRAQKHDKDAAAVCLRIMERRARLLGLDAPVALEGPDGAAIRFVVELPAQAPSAEAWQAAQMIETPEEAAQMPALGTGAAEDTGSHQ